MQGIKRKIVYVLLSEAIAIMITAGVLSLLGNNQQTAGIGAVVTSALAMLWNFVWNTLFEWWEARQQQKGRSLRRRVGHAIGFELGLSLLLVPFFVWWLDISWWKALTLDISMTLFFMVYTFVYNWAFDLVFGLPKSALPECPAS
ncbi:membrane protein [Pokkaliibacter plantistimulans]|uniref:Membrane protein n=1 Tax=Pokkaliibacter plantistimulans TaxID=1635171 RepID=A0ABX5LWA2_9GAMM|nr:PACE efflux transporter [Pokkaliibacter plantistimulans]PXF30941.1 membrane protein [Pokkaliibacter plantistimulans]